MELVYQSARGLTATLSTAKEGAEYVLTSAQGLYDMGVDIYAIDPPEQAGAVWVSSRVRRRVITLEGFVTGSVEVSRRRLAACLSPLEPGWMTLRRVEDGVAFERRICCVVEQGPAFGGVEGTRFKITLAAPSPWWEETGGEKAASLSGWAGGVEFPWSMEEGFQFGGRTPGAAVNVYNPGDAKAGMIIRIYAAGDVDQPFVSRPGTDEEMRIKGVLKEGESLEIGTGVGGKYVKRYGVEGREENGLRYVDTNSTFLQMEPGDNLFRAGAVDGEEALTVAIAFRPGYFSV
ncbi:MAG: phage tail family protein [Oscillospiraceae bacterium]|jgi:hypothetical protein|nr:phage tail family protein [Oscillospiraceae bacterium]